MHAPRGGAISYTGVECVGLVAGSLALSLCIVFGGAVLASSANFALSNGTALPASVGLHPLQGPQTGHPSSVSFNTGRINVVLPSLGPTVNLVQDANASITATFQIVALFEVRPGITPNVPPTVVEAAVPPNYGGYNESSPSSNTTWPIVLSIFVPVVHSDGPILGGTGGFSLPTPTVGAGWTNFTVEVSPGASGPLGSTVAINWSIGSWPWQDRADSLAVAFLLTVDSSAGLTACYSDGSLADSPPACPGTSLAVGRTFWGGAFSGLEGETTHSPTATVTWGEGGSSGEAAPNAVGVVSLSNNTAEVVLANPTAGATSLGHSLMFALVAPSLPPMIPALVGDPIVYGGALVVFSTAVAVSVLAYRKRERQIWEELMDR